MEIVNNYQTFDGKVFTNFISAKNHCLESAHAALKAAVINSTKNEDIRLKAYKISHDLINYFSSNPKELEKINNYIQDIIVKENVEEDL